MPGFQIKNGKFGGAILWRYLGRREIRRRTLRFLRADWSVRIGGFARFARDALRLVSDSDQRERGFISARKREPGVRRRTRLLRAEIPPVRIGGFTRFARDVSRLFLPDL